LLKDLTRLLKQALAGSDFSIRDFRCVGSTEA
jgi:hypothetical protein